MAKINFYLREKNSRNATPILLYVSYGGARLTKYPTGETINPDLWDFRSQKAKSTLKNPNHVEVNIRLKKIAEKAERTLLNYLNKNDKHPDISEYKSLLDDQIKRKVEIKEDLFTFIEKLLQEYESILNENTGRPITKGTLRAYKQSFRTLKEYSQKKYKNRSFSFEQIDNEFPSKYQEFLVSENYKTNTIGKHVKTIKTFLLEANQRGLVSESFNFKKIKKVSEKTVSIYLNDQEIEKLIRVNLSNNKRLESVRDMFIVGCLTGLRFSDFTRITSKNIDNEYIRIETQKTGESVVIPIHRSVQDIINKYTNSETGNILPKPISNQKMNEYLKEIGKLANIEENIEEIHTKGGVTQRVERKKYELITTHTARRSFATNNYKIGIPTGMIMKITGHRTETSFMKYIKITPKESAEYLLNTWNNIGDLNK